MSEEDTAPAGTGTKEAMALLKGTKPNHIAWGAHYAVKIALRKRTVHSQEVFAEMLADKIITGEGKAFWLGAVFRELKDAGVLRKTLHTYSYSNEARNTHERTVALWELNEAADLTPYRTAPEKKP